jgi:hypothetical protein
MTGWKRRLLTPAAATALTALALAGPDDQPARSPLRGDRRGLDRKGKKQAAFRPLPDLTGRNGARRALENTQQEIDNKINVISPENCTPSKITLKISD